jgi:hypothetical protein
VNKSRRCSSSGSNQTAIGVTNASTLANKVLVLLVKTVEKRAHTLHGILLRAVNKSRLQKSQMLQQFSRLHRLIATLSDAPKHNAREARERGSQQLLLHTITLAIDIATPQVLTHVLSQRLTRCQCLKTRIGKARVAAIHQSSARTNR